MLLLVVFRKMYKNKWLVLCQLIGLITCVALISSIPVNTQAVLQKLLIKDMENSQKQDGKYPGTYLIKFSSNDNKILDVLKELEEKKQPYFKDQRVLDFYQSRFKKFSELDMYISKQVEKSIDLPLITKVINYTIDTRKVYLESGNELVDQKDKYSRIESLSNLEKNIRIIDGRLPSKQVENGIYEGLVTESAMKDLDLILGQVYTLKDPRKYSDLEPIRIKPVGVFTVNNENNPYWIYFKPESFSNSILIDENRLREDFINRQPSLIYSSKWYFAFDYHSLAIDKLGYLVNSNSQIVKKIKGYSTTNELSVDAPSIDLISSYSQKSGLLKNMLWSLYVPIILMLFLYLFMISKIIVEREKSEIALLASRGSYRFQIVLGYLVEGLILGAIAFISGLFASRGLSNILGASDGFLQFVSRKALNASLNQDAYIYAVGAIFVSVLTLLLPVIGASKVSIVNYKREVSRKNGRAFWEKFYIDFILIGIAVYGYYSFTLRQHLIRTGGVSARDLQVDPLLFLVPAFFIIGTGLLVLRLYPWILKLVYRIGKSYWSPTTYSTMIQLGRSIKSYHFLMIFLIMTLSTGMFSAASARTINLNSKEKILYKNGADLVAESLWEDDNTLGTPVSFGGGGQDSDSDEDEINYIEPPFFSFTQLEGIENAAKVYIKDNVIVQANEQGSKDNVSFMGINAYDFGKVAWFRNGLLSNHINTYLNTLNTEESACLISTSLSKALNIKKGDSMKVYFNSTDNLIFTVYGVIDYWPSWNPNIDPGSEGKKVPMLIVANLQYMQDHLGVKPYKVWMKLKSGATSKQVYESLAKNNLKLIELLDVNQQLIELRNSPFQLAINGSLTLGFIISGFVCFIGFLIFWILSINSRTLQFGIFRAMGLSLRELISNMVCEQVLTSGSAIVMGIFIGLFTSELFVPFFQIAFDASMQVPPFKVVSDAADRLTIYAIMGSTLLIGFCILGIILSRIKINQAIKLGEE